MTNDIKSTQTPISFPDLGYFSVLPTEVITTIFSYLDVNALCNMTQVCRDFKMLSDDERLWQHIWNEILPTLRLPTDYPMTKVENNKTYKWLCQSKLVKNNIVMYLIYILECF